MNKISPAQRFSPQKNYVKGLTLVLMAAALFSGTNWLIASMSAIQHNKDSADKLQTVINDQYKFVAEYNSNLFRRQETDSAIKVLTAQKNVLNDSSRKAWKSAIAWVRQKNTQETDEQLLQHLKKYMQATGDLEKQINDNKLHVDSLTSNIQLLDAQLNKGREKYKEAVGQLASITKNMVGPGEVVVDKIAYRYFIVNRKEHKIQVHNPQGATTIDQVRRSLQKSKTDPLMITNGGMFAPGFKPQGLLIEQAQKYNNLDTLRPDNKGAMNFYLYPNGVFYTDSTGIAYVLNTDSFRCQFPQRIHPVYATQSGPMLISNNVINANFKAGSSNVNIRNGVGAIDENRAVFIISDVPVNFFDFSLVFKEIFGCRNALYLDGAISQMYITEKLYKKKKPADGQFGPLISITAQKK